jgi:hypothetical protein
MRTSSITLADPLRATICERGASSIRALLLGVLALALPACSQPSAVPTAADPESTRPGRVVLSKSVGEHYQLVEATEDGRILRQLTSGAVDSLFPSVAPDGRTIAFVERDRERESLRVFDRIDGVVRILRDPSDSTYSPPDWSENSGTIVVSRTPGELYSRIELIDVKSGAARELCPGVCPCFDRPNRRIVYLTTQVNGLIALDLTAKSPEGWYEYISVTETDALFCITPRAARERPLLSYGRVKWIARSEPMESQFHVCVIDRETGKKHDHVIAGAQWTCGFVEDESAVLVVARRDEQWDLLAVDWTTGAEQTIAADVGEGASAAAISTRKPASATTEQH